MKAIEAEDDDLKDVAAEKRIVAWTRSCSMSIEGDAFGRIYEYLLGKFAMSEGQKGGEFFTPTSIVKLIVEIIEPFHCRNYDPACDSVGH